MGKGKPTPSEFVIFNQQLASLTKSGLPLSKSLQSLSSEVRSRRLKEGIERVRSDVDAGIPLSEAVRKRSDIFPELYSRIIAAGEKSDNLPEVLSQLAKYSEMMARMRRKVKDALAYPLTVLIAGLVILCLLTLFVLPNLLWSLELIAEEDLAIDFYGRGGGGGFFVAAARVLAYHNVDIIVAIGCLIGLVILGVVFLRSFPGGRALLDRVKLSLPFYGNCIRSAYMLRFSQTLGTLLKSRVPIGDAIYLTAESVGSESMKPAMSRLREEVEGGTRLSESLKKSGIFPGAAVWILSAGDEKGQLDEALMEVSELYEAELERGTGKMAFWLEIFATALIAGFVLFVVLTVFVPIIRLINSMGMPE